MWREDLAMTPMHGPTAEHLRFRAAREVIERARERAGVKLPPFTRGEWDRDRAALRDSSNRKRALRRAERLALEELERAGWIDRQTERSEGNR